MNAEQRKERYWSERNERQKAAYARAQAEGREFSHEEFAKSERPYVKAIRRQNRAD